MKIVGIPFLAMSQCYHRKQRMCLTSETNNLARQNRGLTTSQWATVVVWMEIKCNVIKKVKSASTK
ncbi:hypothetical protein EXN66_Car015515 [Channa argus]|uniref:Uncharacterized protein n=1 Tax=Channa argus TaxID=215402 RepID=A0A6G1QC33_CHAAH|nr:hypothetical protein EXN66_Car015515 [Channa argus]